MPQIPVPPDADINLRNALANIESRLTALEDQDSGSDSSEAVDDLRAQIADISGKSENLEVKGDAWIENDLRAHGDIDMPHLYEGLIKVVPSGEAGTSTAQRVINISGSLAIAPGGLSAESIRARSVDFPRPACRLSRTAVQSIGNNAWEAIHFTQTLYDYRTPMHNDVTNNNRITFNESGFYVVGGCVIHSANAGGNQRGALIVKNEDDFTDVAKIIIAMNIDTETSVTDAPYVHLISASYFGIGEYISMNVLQDSGGANDILAVGRDDTPAFWAVKVSD